MCPALAEPGLPPRCVLSKSQANTIHFAYHCSATMLGGVGQTRVGESANGEHARYAAVQPQRHMNCGHGRRPSTDSRLRRARLRHIATSADWLKLRSAHSRNPKDEAFRKFSSVCPEDATVSLPTELDGRHPPGVRENCWRCPHVVCHGCAGCGGNSSK
jgi:hypothetical protein